MGEIYLAMNEEGKWDIAEMYDMDNPIEALNKAYEQGQNDLIEKAKIGEYYCWQECCATERCGECSRLDNGQIDYFDNTFITNNIEFADMPTTP